MTILKTGKTKMLIQQLTTDLSFPSSTELMIGAVTGTIAGMALLLWIDRINRNNRGKGDNFGLKKRS